MNKILLSVVLCLACILAMSAATATLSAGVTTTEICWDDTEQGSFNLINGNTTTTATINGIWAAVPSSVLDELNITINTGTPFTIGANNSSIVNFTVDVNTVYAETYSVTIYVSHNYGGNDTNYTFTQPIRVRRCFCEGNADEMSTFTIKEPDSGDDFYLGDTIDVEIKVEADDDLDATVEIELYDIDENEVVKDISEDISLEEDEDETFTFSLKIPYDADPDNRFVVNAKAYDEDDEDDCLEDSVDIELKQKSHHIIFDRITLSEEEVRCGSFTDLTVRLGNAGKRDEDVELTFFSNELGIDLSEEDEVQEGEEETFFFNFDIPEDIEEGTYSLKLTAYFNYDDDDDEYRDSATQYEDIEIKGGCVVLTESLSLSAERMGSAFAGESMSFDVKVKNTGTATIEDYQVCVSDSQSWNEQAEECYIDHDLGAGETAIETMYFSIREDISGTVSFTLTLTYNGQTIEEEVTFSVSKETPSASGSDQFWFEFKHNIGWVILIIVLIVVIIVLAIFLGRKPKKIERPLQRKRK
ncbi:MAG: putative S-layer protein [archaeon]|nr:MAG: putative S-layer protein [archaeon]